MNRPAEVISMYRAFLKHGAKSAVSFFCSTSLRLVGEAVNQIHVLLAGAKFPNYNIRE